MSEKVILACDYDGTYRHFTELMPKAEDIEAVRKFRSEGNLFGIVTERDLYEILAIMSIFRGEYDFMVCSSGACAIIKSRDTGNPFPVKLYYNGINPYLVYEAVTLAESAGATGVWIDTPCFKGGMGMANAYVDEYSSEKGIPCKVHFCFDGQFFQNIVNKDAIPFVLPISRCLLRFGSSSSAEGVRAILRQRYAGTVEIQPRDEVSFDLIPAGASKVFGVDRMLEYYGISAESVWSYGDSINDMGMLKKYKGIAVQGSYTADTGEIPLVASSMNDVFEIIKRGI
jgi:hydroxymethylpyrimidine pyrophosphatase-like HAD family hydrolase